MAAAARIGRIRLKSNGAEIRMLPDAAKQRSKEAFRELTSALDRVRELYTDQMDGFAIVVWDRDSRFHAFRDIGNGSVNMNTLPEYVAEALRRENAEDDALNLFNG